MVFHNHDLHKLNVSKTIVKTFSEFSESSLILESQSGKKFQLGNCNGYITLYMMSIGGLLM